MSHTTNHAPHPTAGGKLKTMIPIHMTIYSKISITTDSCINIVALR